MRVGHSLGGSTTRTGSCVVVLPETVLEFRRVPFLSTFLGGVGGDSGETSIGESSPADSTSLSSSLEGLEAVRLMGGGIASLPMTAFQNLME